MKVLVLDVRLVYRFVWWSTVAVIALGIGRELIVDGLEKKILILRPLGLDQKHSLQAWQQSSLAFIGLATSAALAGIEPLLRRYWIALTLLMLLISIDEQISLHQSTIWYLGYFHDFSGLFRFSWVLWAVPVCCAIGAWFVPFLLKIPRRYALGFLAAGAMFLGGAVGLEMIGGIMVDRFGRDSWQYKLEFITEESLESIGLSLFVVTSLAYWRHVCGSVAVAVDPAAETQAAETG